MPSYSESWGRKLGKLWRESSWGREELEFSISGRYYAIAKLKRQKIMGWVLLWGSENRGLSDCCWKDTTEVWRKQGSIRLGQKEVEKRIWCLADLLKSTFDPVKFKEEMREEHFFLHCLQQAELPFLHLWSYPSPLDTTKCATWNGSQSYHCLKTRHSHRPFPDTRK